MHPIHIVVVVVVADFFKKAKCAGKNWTQKWWPNGQFLYGILEQVFNHFTKHMKIMLGDCNAKLGTEVILKLTFGNESLNEDNNDKGIKGVKYNAQLTKVML